VISRGPAYTLLAEMNFPPNFEWEKIDRQKTLKILKNLNQVRGGIIDSAINLEFHLDVIICKILFGSYTSKEAILFRRFALPKNFGFHSKVRFLEKIVEANKPPKAHLTKQWLERLKNINIMRNFLAHGIQSSELPLKNREEPETAISLIKNGKYKEAKVTKAEVEKIKKDIKFCLKFIIDKLVKEGLENYFG